MRQPVLIIEFLLIGYERFFQRIEDVNSVECSDYNIAIMVFGNTSDRIITYTVRIIGLIYIMCFNVQLAI